MKTIDELIELHRNNTKELIAKRSISPEDSWRRGTIRKINLTQTLRKFSSEVGILLYTYDEGYLIIDLIKKSGDTDREKLSISREGLIHKINQTNQYFSSAFMARNAQKRDFVFKSIPPSDKYQEAYEFVNQHLFPFNFGRFDHLIIVPTLNIGILPFAAMKVPGNAYLIDQVSYSIAPSLFELLVSNNMNTFLDADLRYHFSGEQSLSYYQKLKNCLFVADPQYPTDTKWSFPPLPGTIREVKQIRENLPDLKNHKILTGEKATVENIMQDICEYDLLYFGTHGVSDEENPLDASFLVVAAHPKGKHFISARAIQDLRHSCKLKAHLVVLSACQTALGQEHQGGMIGLARAFQIAGANHILMSLWNINDSETAILMNLFFKYLKSGNELLPHEALRRAILEFKAGNGNPNYWAAFSIFGIPMWR